MYLRLVGILKPEVSPLAMGPLESVSHPLKPSLPTPSMLVQATQPTTAALKKKKLFIFGCAGSSLLLWRSLVAASGDCSTVEVCRLLPVLVSSIVEAHRLQ